MRRSTLAAAGALVALTAVIPVPVQAGDTDSDRRGDRAEVSDHVEVLRLECGARSTDDGLVVGCAWSAPSEAGAAGLELLRLDPATDQHRRVIFRTGDLGVTSHTDGEVRPGHRYAYVVRAVDERGRVVARSRTQWVEVPQPDVGVLRLACALGPAQEAIGCEWSRPASRDAWVVTLWRSIDGGGREAVERFRPSRPNTYRERVPAGASEVTYAVIATSERDRIVARSRPETVRIPRLDGRTPTEVALPDLAPIDVVGTDVAPIDVAPIDVVGTDVARADAARSDVAPTHSTVDAVAGPRVVVLPAELRARLLRLIRELAAL
jgi:hypothetical protein